MKLAHTTLGYNLEKQSNLISPWKIHTEKGAKLNWEHLFGS
jgi:hypothetical protein